MVATTSRATRGRPIVSRTPQPMTAPMRSRAASWTAPVARGEQAEYQAQDQGRDGERDPNGDAGEVGHAPAPGPRVPSFPLAVEAPAALDYGPVARHHVALEPTGFGYDHARSARRRCARRPRSRGRRRSARSRHFGSCVDHGRAVGNEDVVDGLIPPDLGPPRQHDHVFALILVGLRPSGRGADRSGRRPTAGSPSERRCASSTTTSPAHHPPVDRDRKWLLSSRRRTGVDRARRRR